MRETRVAKRAPRLRDFFALQPWIASAEGWRAGAGEDRLRSLVEQWLLVVDRKNRDVAPPGRLLEALAATAHPFGPSRLLTVRADPIVPPLVVEQAALVVQALSFERLAGRIAKDLDLDDPATDLDDERGSIAHPSHPPPTPRAPPPREEGGARLSGRAPAWSALAPRGRPPNFTAGSSATDRTASPDAQRKRDPGGVGANARRCWRMTPFAPCVLRGLKNTLRPAPPAHVCPARARADRAP